MKTIFHNRILQLALILILGLFLGWLIFKDEQSPHHHHTEEESKETTWTCSMHPQIRQDEPGNCPICGMSLIQLAKRDKTAAFESPFIYTMSDEAVALANIQTTRVKKINPEHQISLTGRIALNEQKLSVITANYSGRVEELFVDFTGQAVSRGDKLAVIYSPELVTAQQELLEATRTKSRNPALYEAAKEKLRLWKISDEQIHHIEKNGIILTEFDVYARISGIVTSRRVSRGDYVSRGNVLFEIADLSNVWVLLDAYESDLPFLKKGGSVNFTLASIPGKQFSSTITFIDPIINPQTRTIRVRAEAQNPGLMLKPDMFVNAIIKSGLPGHEDALMIPASSVLWTGKRSVVYVKLPDSKTPAFEMREITLGSRIGDAYIIESGLNLNEDVVTHGVFAVDAAAQLSGNFSMMSRPVSKQIDVPEEFKHQLTLITNEYFKLKNDLVESDFSSAKRRLPNLRQTFSELKEGVLEENAHQAWMALHEIFDESLNQLKGSNNIDELREHFSSLSDALIEAVEKFGTQLEAVYLAYCPMAFDDQGAYWLSEFEDIKNPYFGDMMLRCGEVRKEFSTAVSYEKPPATPHAGHQH